jgi:hypothetical protein
VAWDRLTAALTAGAKASDADQVNQHRRAHFDTSRSWVWCGWRDEVRLPNGKKASMRRALAGRLKPLLN